MSIFLQWADQCKSYLVEAEWYHNDCKPSFHEYIENAWITIATPIILFHGYFALPDSANTDGSILFKEYSNIIRYTSNLTRLANDLGTYKVSLYNPFSWSETIQSFSIFNNH